MSKDGVKNNNVIKPYIISSVVFILVGSFIGSIWLALIVNVKIPLIHESIFSLHRIFQVDSGLTLLIMGIGFMIIPRFRNIPIGSLTTIKVSFLLVIISTMLAIVSSIIVYEPIVNWTIQFISKIFRLLGIFLFVLRIFDTLKIKPRLLRHADYFVGLSSICLLIMPVFDLFRLNEGTLMDIESQLLFPIIMIFGIQYKTLPSFLGFIKPRKRFGMLSLLFLCFAFALGLVTKLVDDPGILPVLFGLFMLFSSIAFSISVYVYNNYENKKYILKSTMDKKERYLYTLHHTRISFCFLYLGFIFGLLFFISDNKFIFYDLCIHFIAIGFIGITITSYLPMMLAPVLGKPIVVKKINQLPLILITISLITRSMGMFYISYFDGNGSSPFHSLTSISGFLVVLAIIIFMVLMHKSIKTNN
jgi:hypothetical protein